MARRLGVLLTVGMLVSCTLSSDPELRPAAPISAQGVGISGVADSVWVTSLGAYCIESEGAATITSVELKGAEGLRLDAVGVEPGTAWASADSGSLADLDLSTDRQVTTVCDGEVEGGFSAINVQLSLTGEPPARFDSAVVHWDSGDRSGSIPVPIEFVIKPR